MSKTGLAIEYSMSIIEEIITDAVTLVENNNAEGVDNITVPEENCEFNAESQDEAKEQDEQKEVRSKYTIFLPYIVKIETDATNILVVLLKYLLILNLTFYTVTADVHDPPLKNDSHTKTSTSCDLATPEEEKIEISGSHYKYRP